MFGTVTNALPSNTGVSYPLSFIYPIPRQGLTDFTNRTGFLIVQVTVSANDTIAERVPVLLSNALGTIGSALAPQISAVAIGFDGSFFLGHPNSLLGTAFAGSFLLKAGFNTTLTGMSMNLGGADLVGNSVSIYWPVQGDYHASLVFIGTNGTFWRQEYPENRVHVEPASTLHQEQFGRNLNAIEIGGFFVAMYEAFVRISEWESERKKVGNGKRHEKSIVRLDTNTSHQEQTSSKKEPKAVRQEGSTVKEHNREGSK